MIGNHSGVTIYVIDDVSIPLHRYHLTMAAKRIKKLWLGFIYRQEHADPEGGQGLKKTKFNQNQLIFLP